jgi:phenylpropionate dioxygenase-like ring-hydroxylating dioxygenase large terminal subunit
MPADFDKSNHGLTEVPLEIWQGFVYVNLDRDAAPLAPRLAPLDEVFDRYGLSRYVTLNKEEEIWNTNWKIATENFMESYHLAIGHAATMGLNYPANLMKMTDEGDDFAFHSMQTVDEFLIPLDPKIAMPNRPISDEDFRTLYAGGIFPNHLFTLAYDQAIWMRTQPLAVDKTLIQWGVCGAFEWPEGTGPDPSHPNQYFVPGMVPVNAEDKRITESVQAGAYSDVQPSELHKDEHGLYTFAKYLKRRLADSKPVGIDGRS